jgi:integrase
LPDLSEPYRKAPKVSHRAWFAPGEYKQLYEATRELAQNPSQPRWQTTYENLHDFVLFMVNTGIRPDEALGLQYRDIQIIRDPDSGDELLEITVRGKRGTGYCKSMPGAVRPFRRYQKRNGGTAKTPIFPKLPNQLFDKVLHGLDLKEDREGNPRTIYSLRHTYISLRLTERANIYEMTKNFRTSVEMIQKYYASHIADFIDAGAINVRKPKSTVSKAPRKPKGRPTSRLAKKR